MKLVLVQAEVPVSEDRIEAAIRGFDPQEGQPGIICLPEIFHADYADLPDGARTAETVLLPKTAALLISRPSVALVGTAALRSPDGVLNTLTVFHAGQAYPLYDKLHLFPPMGERELFLPGDHLAILEIRSLKTTWTIGFATCYDLRFPELFRLLAQAGCDLVIVPAQWPAVRVGAWRTLLQARAAENQFYVAGVNRCGSRAAETYGGGSLVADPDGEILVSAGAVAGTSDVFLEKELIGRSRRRFQSILHRRDDLYRLEHSMAVRRLSLDLSHKSK